MNKVFVLGVGPGNKDYIPPVSLKKIEKADILIGGKRILNDFTDRSKEKIQITANLDKIIDYIEENFRQKQIAVLVSGDPGLYSFLKYLKNYFPEKHLKVIPGISSLQLAFARNKMIWQDAEIISLHGKDNKDKLVQSLRKNQKIALFTDDKHSPDQIAKYLLSDRIEDKNVFIAENLSYPEENLYKGKLSDITDKNFSRLTVMVIYDGKE